MAKYQSGCSIMENLIPIPQGGAQKRPGTKFIAEVKTSSLATRILPFEFSTSQSYIIEVGNQYMRFYVDGAVQFKPAATEDLSSHTSNIKAHWLLNDNLATTAVIDDDGATHDGVLYGGDNSTANSEDATDTDGADAVNRSFDMSQLTGSTGAVLVSDSGDFTFGDGTDDSAFTLHTWIKFTSTSARQDIMSKWSELGQEWELYVDTDDKVVVKLWDDSAELSTSIKADDALTESVWTFIVATYTGEGGATAANGLKLYTDWVISSTTVTNNASYVAMEDKAGDVMLGGVNGVAQILIPQSRGTPIGNMNESGTSLADAFDGDNDEPASESATNTVNPKDTQVFIGKDWGAGNEKLITGFKAWGSNGDEPPSTGFISTDDPTVKITLQGSTDNFSSSTVDLGNVSDTDAAGKLIQKLSGLTITTAYRYHRLAIEYLTLPTTRNIHCAEAEFYTTGGGTWASKLDNMAVLDVELSGSEIAALTSADTTTPLEIATPYLTADLFDLNIEQSADVLYITHPSYEVHKLSRTGSASWTLTPVDITTGPFRTQNFDVVKTITPSGTTGSITLTATGHTPFVAGTTEGHLPSGSDATSMSQTGALFKLVHPLETLSFKDTLEDDIVASSVEGVSWMACGTLYKGATWSWVTGGTWLGTVAVQRNYTLGAVFADSGWETVLPFDGVTTARNVTESGTEDDGDADYRVAFLDDTSGIVESYFTTDQTEVVGIVEITAVASTTSATGTVIRTLGDTAATYKWSEGSWSNYRGWPQTVTFFEDRLMFGGNTAQPDTIWGSVTSFYDNMTAGPDDDEALIFTLSSRQVNVIEWIIGKDKLLIGTSGAEWTIAGGTDEPLTPSNAIAKQHSTYGSASLQAGIANESILFFQRGAEKMRELAYNWELDSYVAPDMTILANLVTNGGVAETSFQRTPNSILWCVRNDGELPVFSYERKENVTAWSRMVTADSTGDSDFESIAVITGSPEDEVWVVVERTMAGVNSGNPVRYVEQFQPRDFGSDADDAYYVDCGITYDSTATTTITGLAHLEGETVSVLGDGVVLGDEVVVSGQITIDTSSSTVQVGLPYEIHLRTMPLSWVGGGTTIQGMQKRISEVIPNWYNSGDFSVGRDVSTLGTINITGQTTSQDRITFPPGYDRNGYIYVYQKSPEPLTLLALAIEFDVN